MSKMIQIRDVPDQVHRTLKARAAQEGMSLSDYIKRELKNIAARPSIEEWLESTRGRTPIRGNKSAVQIIREMRDAR